MGAVLVDYDLGATDGGFVSGGSPLQWEWGVAVDGPAGETGWSTRLDGPYLHEATSTLTLPAVDLSAHSDPHLVVDLWTALVAGDAVLVEANDGTGWSRLDPVYGYPTLDGWSGDADFAEFAFGLNGLGGSPGLRLVLVSDAAGTDDGATIRGARLEDGDAAAPRVSLVSAPTDAAELHAAAVVVVDVADDRTVVEVAVITSSGTVPATELVPGRWQATLPDGAAPDTVLTWRVEAQDGDNVGRFPVVGDASFRWFLPPPTDVTVADPGARHVAQSLTVSFAAPTGVNVPLSYQVRIDGAVVADVGASPASVPLLVAGEMLDVAGVYAEGVGDFSPALAVDVSVPSALLSPSAAAPSARLWADLEGSFLGLVEGATVDLGAGVTVEALDIVDVDSARLTLRVDDGAASGDRTLVVDGAWGAFAFEGAFTVDASLAAPAIVDVAPATVAQGHAADVRFRSSTPFARVPALSADAALAIGNVRVDGADCTATVTPSGAATIGPYDVVLDDGLTIQVATLEVTESVFAPERRCGLASRSGAWISLLAALSARRVRAGRLVRSATGR